MEERLGPWGRSSAKCDFSTIYSYTPIDSRDNATVKPNLARQTTQWFNGTPVACSYAIYATNLDILIQCTNATGAYTDAGNLVTTNLYVTNGYFYGWLESAIRPDGTATLYNYATNATGPGWTNTVATGAPNLRGQTIAWFVF